VKTPDIGGRNTTSEVGAAVARLLTAGHM